jgi:hypothetical protein
MNDPADVWDAVVAKLARSGRESLSRSERTFYLINRLVVDFDVGGLSGFLYNTSPSSQSARAWTELRATAEAVESVGSPEIGSALRQAADLLEALPVSGRGTWDTFLRPIESQLQALESTLCVPMEALWDRLDELAAQVDS